MGTPKFTPHKILADFLRNPCGFSAGTPKIYPAENAFGGDPEEYSHKTCVLWGPTPMHPLPRARYLDEERERRIHADARRTFPYVSSRVNAPDKAGCKSSPSRNQRFCDGNSENLPHIKSLRNPCGFSAGTPKIYPAENAFGGDPEEYSHKTCVLRGPTPTHPLLRARYSDEMRESPASQDSRRTPRT